MHDRTQPPSPSVIDTAILERLPTQPASRIAELLPHRWQAGWRCYARRMSAKTTSKRPKTSCIYQLRIELQHIEPLIWRRIFVPDALRLAKLDRVVQAAMGWTNSHLHDWHIEQQRYGIPDEEWIGGGDMLDERKVTIGAVLGEHVQAFGYGYDFGDDWQHNITVEQRLEIQEGRNNWPMCLAGENACPPEDVGGPPGYMDFLEAMHNSRHGQHADYLRWWGGPFDPRAFSINAANMTIRKLR
ncbi:plasmid pRiA4b ORF-3 family protein [Variovorax soli]|uniref:plasmid pRiA4b ORF-3 family protein n=1 Tax=Variovorax soli TaxID=376815 RepID=UPI001FDFB465|nr:plasmid pRiA4b ORF-3 family protein [Variovorax soli]